MATRDGFGWRDRAIALASLGAATLGRFAFTPADPLDPQPLEMEVLVALALQDSLAADPPHRSGIQWLSLALRLEQPAVADIVRRLEDAALVGRSPGALDDIEWELGGEVDEDDVLEELPIAVTDLGFDIVDRWLYRTRLHFGGWPPERADVDDAVG
jgi:hypothetical protein